MRYLILLILPLLTSCATMAITGITEGGKAAADERSLGTQMDDAGIYARINGKFINSDNQDVTVNVTVNVRYGRVMLTGNVDNQESIQKAADLAWEVAGVKEVINEINVVKDSVFWNNANDALIKKNIEARLLTADNVWVVNYSIDAVNGTAYLLGVVKDEGEMDRVLSITRSTRGVKRVVNYLQVNVAQANQGIAESNGGAINAPPVDQSSTKPAFR